MAITPLEMELEKLHQDNSARDERLLKLEQEDRAMIESLKIRIEMLERGILALQTSSALSFMAKEKPKSFKHAKPRTKKRN